MGLSDLVGAVTGIADVFLNLGNLVEYLIYALFELLPAFFSLFNPINIINDSITGTIIAIKVVLIGIMDLFKRKKKNSDKCKETGSGLFGFRKTGTGNGSKLSKCGPGRKCVRNRWLVLIITIICPPLALAQHLGMKGFFQVIIASFLTVYMYYFPGLIYTLLHTINFDLS